MKHAYSTYSIRHIIITLHEMYTDQSQNDFIVTDEQCGRLGLIVLLWMSKQVYYNNDA